MRSFTLPAYAFLAVLLPIVVGCQVKGVDTSSSENASTTTSSGGVGGSGGSGGMGPFGDPISIANYNARNFFDDVDDPLNDQEIVLSSAEYQAKRENVAAVIKLLNPDVLVLAEIESFDVLATLNQIELEGAYPYQTLIESPDPRGIDIGALSKMPFDQVVSHQGETFAKIGTNGPFYSYARDCLELHFRFNGQKFILLGVHFRSKGPPDDPDKRLAEAQYTRKIADDLAMAEPDAAIVILGDYNDVTASPAVQAIAGSGETAFTDVASLAPQEDQWTFDFNGTLELVDHQMVNPVMWNLLDKTSVQIPHGMVIDAAGDHAPIFAVYKVAP